MKPYEKILFEKEQGYKGDDGGDRYSAYVDGKKRAEHLTFNELIELLNILEESRGEK